jgi:uncharacterized SAM-binding protein YcdF (DUF218 family)
MPLEVIEQAWTGEYQTKGSLKHADCVLGFSFGYRGKGKSVTPGLSNQDLANVCSKQFAGLPKILQFEIADAYEQAGGEGAEKVLRISKHRRKGQYLDTREVAEQGQRLMAKQGWKTAVLLAHPYHMPRIQMVCTHLGINWVATDDLRGAVEFDPQSTQKWTRSVDQWRGYEPLAITFYRMKGWL